MSVVDLLGWRRRAKCSSGGQRTECKSDCVKNCAVPLFTATAIGSHSVYGHSSVSGMCSGKFDHLLRGTTISVLIFYKTEAESHTERQRATPLLRRVSPSGAKDLVAWQEGAVLRSQDAIEVLLNGPV